MKTNGRCGSAGARRGCQRRMRRSADLVSACSQTAAGRQGPAACAGAMVITTRLRRHITVSTTRGRRWRSRDRCRRWHRHSAVAVPAPPEARSDGRTFQARAPVARSHYAAAVRVWHAAARPRAGRPSSLRESSRREPRSPPQRGERTRARASYSALRSCKPSCTAQVTPCSHVAFCVQPRRVTPECIPACIARAQQRSALPRAPSILALGD